MDRLTGLGGTVIFAVKNSELSVCYPFGTQGLVKFSVCAVSLMILLENAVQVHAYAYICPAFVPWETLRAPCWHSNRRVLCLAALCRVKGAKGKEPVLCAGRVGVCVCKAEGVGFGFFSSEVA